MERLLAKHKDAILRELNLDSVLPVLMDKGIFEEEEKDQICDGSTNEERYESGISRGIRNKKFRRWHRLRESVYV